MTRGSELGFKKNIAQPSPTDLSSMRKGTMKKFDESSESQKDDVFDAVADQENQFHALFQ